jgi:hypothetical protein
MGECPGGKNRREDNNNSPQVAIVPIRLNPGKEV